MTNLLVDSAKFQSLRSRAGLQRPGSTAEYGGTAMHPRPATLPGRPLPELFSRGSQQVAGGHDQRRAVLKTDAGQNPLHVLVNCARAGLEDEGNLGIRFSLGDPVGDFGLTRREPE